MSTQIREMTAADVPKVAALEAENFSVPWSETGFADVLCREDVLFLVASDANRILGYAGVYCSLDEGEITNVCVAASARRTGIGERLMCELLERLRERGIFRVVLEVRSGNAPAIHLYGKLGFEVVGTRRDFYERPKEDAFVMVREPIVSTGG